MFTKKIPSISGLGTWVYGPHDVWHILSSLCSTLSDSFREASRSKPSDRSRVRGHCESSSRSHRVCHCLRQLCYRQGAARPLDLWHCLMTVTYLWHQGLMASRPLDRCTSVHLDLWASVPMYFRAFWPLDLKNLCTNVPLYLWTYLPLYRCTPGPICLCISVSLDLKASGSLDLRTSGKICMGTCLTL